MFTKLLFSFDIIEKLCHMPEGVKVVAVRDGHGAFAEFRIYDPEGKMPECEFVVNDHGGLSMIPCQNKGSTRGANQNIQGPCSKQGE